jgi:phage tail protein X
MADVTYITKYGDMVDLICFRHYGHTIGTTEKVLAANPGLAALCPLPPKGTRILLPDLGAPAKQTPVKKTVRLWD